MASSTKDPLKHIFDNSIDTGNQLLSTNSIKLKMHQQGSSHVQCLQYTHSSAAVHIQYKPHALLRKRQQATDAGQAANQAHWLTNLSTSVVTGTAPSYVWESHSQLLYDKTLWKRFKCQMGTAREDTTVSEHLTGQDSAC